MYSGTDLMIWNPANSVSSAYRWDFTLGSSHIFGFTDYATISNTSLSNLNSSARNAITIDSRSLIPENSSNRPLVVFDTDFGEKRASFNIQIAGPAVSFSIKDKWKIGLFTKVRAHGSAQSIPESLGIYELNTARFTDFSLNLEPFEGVAMAWTEIGGHIASKLSNEWSVGINLKYLFGSEAAFFENDTNGLINIDADNIASNGVFLNANLKLTNNLIDGQNYRLFENLNSGIGYGTDIGVSYATGNWSAGVSIIDIGYVQFTQNTELYNLSSSDIEIDISNYEVITTARELLDQIAADFNTQGIENEFPIGLPAALVLQGSYQFDQQWYISGQMVQRVQFAEDVIRRENSIAITPHYSSKWISVFAPVTIYEYSKLRLGLAARLGVLTLGSDHLGTIFRKHDFRGSDIYVKLSFAPFFACDERRSSRKRRNKGVECYSF